jgi:hypothetical protein
LPEFQNLIFEIDIAVNVGIISTNDFTAVHQGCIPKIFSNKYAENFTALFALYDPASEVARDSFMLNAFGQEFIVASNVAAIEGKLIWLFHTRWVLSRQSWEGRDNRPTVNFPPHSSNFLPETVLTFCPTLPAEFSNAFCSELKKLLATICWSFDANINVR